MGRHRTGGLQVSEQSPASLFLTEVCQFLLVTGMVLHVSCAFLVNHHPTVASTDADRAVSLHLFSCSWKSLEMCWPLSVTFLELSALIWVPGCGQEWELWMVLASWEKLLVQGLFSARAFCWCYVILGAWLSLFCVSSVGSPVNWAPTSAFTGTVFSWAPIPVQPPPGLSCPWLLYQTSWTSDCRHLLFWLQNLLLVF